MSPGDTHPIPVDWSEQRHHLAGAVGRGMLDRFTELDWIERAESTRAVRVTPDGRRLSRSLRHRPDGHSAAIS